MTQHTKNTSYTTLHLMTHTLHLMTHQLHHASFNDPTHEEHQLHHASFNDPTHEEHQLTPRFI